MHRFTDSKGDVWRLSITIGHIKPVEADTGVNLLRMDRPFELQADDWVDEDGQPLILMTRLEMDLELLYSVIYSLCREEAADRQVDEVEFGKRMGISDDGHDAFADAFGAFWQEAESFFQQTRRGHLAAVIRKQRDLITKAMVKVTSEVEEKVNTDEIIRKIFGDSSGSTQALSASTPTR